jgi:hypothetical protein
MINCRSGFALFLIHQQKEKEEEEKKRLCWENYGKVYRR